MTTRDEVFDKFGPLLLESMLETILSELNIVRGMIGQPDVSIQHMLDSIDTKNLSLEKYDWMKALDDKIIPKVTPREVVLK